MVRLVIRHRDTRRAWGGPVPLAALLSAALTCGIACGLTSCAQPSGAQPAPAAGPAVEPGTDGPTTDPTVEPARPAAMSTPDAAGARATVEYALALLPYAFTTGELDAWEALSHDDCRFCHTVIADARALHTHGARREGGVYSIHTVKVFEPTPGHDYFAVDLTVEQSPTQERGPAGELLAEDPTRHVLMFTAVGWTDGGWRVREITANEIDGP